MSQYLRGFPALSEDQGLVPAAMLVAWNYL